MKEALIRIVVSPKSSKRKIVLQPDNVIKVYLHSPPIDGKANSECVLLFSKILHVAKSNIHIVKGEKGKNKVLRINGIDNHEVIRLIKDAG